MKSKNKLKKEKYINHEKYKKEKQNFINALNKINYSKIKINDSTKREKIDIINSQLNPISSNNITPHEYNNMKVTQINGQNLNTLNYSDNIKLLSQEKPSEMSSIIPNSNFYNNKYNFITNKDQSIYNINNTNFIKKNELISNEFSPARQKYQNNLSNINKILLTDNPSNFKIMVTIDNSYMNLKSTFKLIENEKINIDIVNMFKRNNLLINYDDFISKMLDVFDQYNKFNYYNHIGPFLIILEEKNKAKPCFNEEENQQNDQMHNDLLFSNPKCVEINELDNNYPLKNYFTVSIKEYYQEIEYTKRRINKKHQIENRWNTKDNNLNNNESFLHCFNQYLKTNIDTNNDYFVNKNNFLEKLKNDTIQEDPESKNNINDNINDNDLNNDSKILKKDMEKTNFMRSKSKFVTKDNDDKLENIIKSCNNNNILDDSEKNNINNEIISLRVSESQNNLKKTQDENKETNTDVIHIHSLNNNKIRQKCFIILLNDYIDDNSYVECISNQNNNILRVNKYINNNKYNPYNQRNFVSSDIKSLIQNTNSVINQSTINFTINNNISMGNLFKHNKSKSNRKKRLHRNSFSMNCSDKDYLNVNSTPKNFDYQPNNVNFIPNSKINGPNKIRSCSNFKTNALQYSFISSKISKNNNILFNKMINSNSNTHQINSINKNNQISPNALNFIHSYTNTNSHLNNPNLNSKYQANSFIKINSQKNRNKDIASSSTSNPQSLVFEKLSALLHDFKHIVYDNLIYFDHLVSKYIFPLISNQQTNYNYVTIKNFTEFGQSNLISNLNNINVNNQNKAQENNPLTKTNSLGNTMNNINLYNNSVFNNTNNFFLSSTNNNLNNISYKKNPIFHTNLSNANNYSSNFFDINKLREELVYLSVIKDYTISLILNITNFMSDNDFLAGNIDEPIDFIKIINLMVIIFKRRLEYENCILENFELKNNNHEENINISINNNLNFNNHQADHIHKKKDINIRAKVVDIDNVIYSKLKSNKNLIISLLYNVISNAYKYTERGEIVIETFIETDNNSKKNFIFINVSDTGKGIPSDVINSWGMPFNIRDKSKGTGLGQFLVTSICEKLGFKLFKPEKNPNSASGTVFKILIPVDDKLYPEINSNSNLPVNNYSPFFINKNSNKKLINSNTNNTNQNSQMISMTNFNHSNVNNNGSSINLKTTLLNNCPLEIDEKLFLLSPFANIISNHSISVNELNSNLHKTKTNMSIMKKTIYIICLDDDPIILSMHSKNLKDLAKEFPQFKFELILTLSFPEFISEFMALTMKNIVVDIFIMDQNISYSLKGIDCCKLINKFYKIFFKDSYNKLKFNFVFVSEECRLHKYKIMQNNLNLIKKDQIFSKLQIKPLYSKLVHIIKNIKWK